MKLGTLPREDVQDPGEHMARSSTQSAQERVLGRPWAQLVGLVLVVLLVAGVLVNVVASSRIADDEDGAVTPGEGGVEGTVVYGALDQRDDLLDDVVYAQRPPVGGNHFPVWERCGIHRDPVRDVQVVHTLAHGAVWLTYREDTPPEQVEALEAHALQNDKVVVSPYPEQEAPVVATAWARQLPLENAADPRVGAFVSAYVDNPRAPEAGATCEAVPAAPR